MPEKEYQYDVFISYSHDDEDWVVNTLLPRLEGEGLKVCVDFRDFKPGVPSIVNMENAVDDSDHTLLVLTPNWTGSEWTDFEAILTQTDDPVGRRQKTIPLMLKECRPPKRVRSLTYVDFIRSDREDFAWRQLFTALGVDLADQAAGATPADAPAHWFLKHPYGMPPNFTGRADERQLLTGWLATDPDHPLLVLRALGGFGKSALAWHWITHDLDAGAWPSLVWWGFYDERNFEVFLLETLHYLTGRDLSKLPPSQQVETLLQLLRQPGTLLILDGFERALRAYGGMGAAYQGDEEPGNQGTGNQGAGHQGAGHQGAGHQGAGAAIVFRPMPKTSCAV